MTRATLYIYVYARMDWNKDVVHLCTFKFSWDGRRGGREGVIGGVEGIGGLYCIQIEFIFTR